MTSDDAFDRGLRASFDHLADEPAPERLVARIQAIPHREPQPVRGPRLAGLTSRWTRFAGGLAAAALVLVAAGLLLGRGPGAGVGGLPGGSPGTGSAGPNGSAATPAASASTVPTATAIPATLAAPPSATTAGGALPAGFAPQSATFVSADAGWVLGGVPCGSSTCLAIAHTTDGGRTWLSAPAPATTIAPSSGGSPDLTGSGVSAIRFADALDGWAFGPELWSTHDGGATWTRETVPGLSSQATTVALETAAGMVHAVFYDGGGGFVVASGPVFRSGWALSPITIPVGAGPVPRVQLVLSGAAGWILENDRTVVAGARLVGGTWRSWRPACLDVVGPAVLAASSPTDVVAACDIGQWGTPQGDRIFASTDGGATFSEIGTRTPLTGASTIASPGGATIVVGGSGSAGGLLVGSFDHGRTWSTLVSSGQAGISELGFTTVTQGYAISTSGTGGRMWMTRDGGRTWTRVSF